MPPSGPASIGSSSSKPTKAHSPQLRDALSDLVELAPQHRHVLLKLRNLCHASQRTADQGSARGSRESEAGYSTVDYSLAESLLVTAS